MSQPVNPYVAGAPLRGERGFFGRQDTLDWVARELRNPATNALVLFGQRRIGKTSLLLQLQRTLPTDAFLPVYFDLQGQATRPLGAVLADLADTVAEQACLEPPDQNAFDDRGHFFRRTFLPGLCAALSEARRPVFLFDEFDVLDQVAEAELPETAAAKAFFPFLQRTMIEETQPAFVFVVGRRAEDLSLDCNRTFKTSLVQYVWVLDQESAEALVRQAEANGTLHFTDRAIARILSLTCYHPYLTQLLCQRIWERGYARNPTAPPRIDAPEVEAAVSDALEAGDQALVWLWNGLSPAEKIYTAALAELADEGATISEDQVIQVLSAHAARLRTREVELAPRDLVKRRVLEVAEEREYRFAVELFRRWVRQHKPMQEVKDELDRIEPVAEHLFLVGQGFFNGRQWNASTRYFREALEVNPCHFRARLHLGEALLQLGQTDEAMTELERAYELDQDEARLPLTRALVAQAQAREKAGDENGALAACERALQVSPNEQTAQKIRAAIWTRRLEAEARSHERAERWSEAIAVYEQLVTHAPDEKKRVSWEVALEHCREEELLAHLFDEGVTALEKKNWQRAQKVLAEVVHGQPDYKRNRQRASWLLDRAILRKPVRKYGRVLAAVLTTILVAVVGVWYFQPWRESQLMPPVELPEQWKPISTWRLDTNGDGVQEDLTFYRFDVITTTNGEQSGPIAAVVYQQDDSIPPNLISYELLPQDGSYLCECKCTPTMENALTGLEGDELVVRDDCDGEITRLAIFYWDRDAEVYLPRGHFSGDRIMVALDKVTVDRRLPDRAQLAIRQTYCPDDGNKIYYPTFEKYEYIFYDGEPEDVTLSPYPEKVVLAFYNHYTDSEEEISKYFTDTGWEGVDKCAAGQCGCTAKRSDIEHVRVIYLLPGEETCSEPPSNQSEPPSDQCEKYGPDGATVEAIVICEHKNEGQEDDQQQTLEWRLVREGDRWKLDSVDVKQTQTGESEGGEQ